MYSRKHCLAVFFTGLFFAIITTYLHADGGDSSLIHACVDQQNIIRLSGPAQTCASGETSLHWSIQGPPGPTDPVLLGRISTLEAQVATLQSQVASLVNPVLPDILISDVSLGEGASGNQHFTFTVALSMPSALTVVVEYFTTDGTADSSDYTGTSGQLVYLPGETSKLVSVTVPGDTDIELDETFFLQPGAVVNANTAGAIGTGVIVNDDFPALSLSGQLNGIEGDLYNYDVVLSSPSPAQVSVNYSVVDGTATLAGNDFANTSGTLIFAPGQTSAQFTVQTNVDSIPEGQEDFSVRLDNPVNAILSSAQFVSLLLDTSTVGVSIQNASVAEGNQGNSPFTIMQMDVVLDQVLSGQASVRYGQSNGGTATYYSFFNPTGDVRVIPFSSCHADASPATCPTLVFNPGETRKTINIQIYGDTVVESDENFFVKIFDPIGTVIADNVAEGVIIDDD